MRKKITKRSVEELARKARDAGQTLLAWDTELRGFGARATANGTVAYFIEYRLGGRGGRNRRMTIGRHGDLTANQARKAAEKYRGQIRDGVDVAQTREHERARLTADTLAEVAERFLALNAKPGRYWSEVRRLLGSEDIKDVRKRPLPGIARADIAAAIDNVARRSPSAARSLFAALRPLFAWAMERGIIEQSPCVGLRAPPAARARDRVLSEAEIKAFWQATAKMEFPFDPIFRLLLVTGQRRKEVAGARWSEFDLDSQIWTLPPERTKNGRPHILDLSPQALAILECASRCDELLFSTTGATPPSGFSKAKARLDEGMGQFLGGKLPPWRIHDLRRTAATGMAGLGFPPQVVERVINHVSGAQGGLVGVYQRHEYRVERKAAMDSWGAEVERIACGEERGGNIVTLVQRR